MDEIQFNAEHESLQPANDDGTELPLDEWVRLIAAEVWA